MSVISDLDLTQAEEESMGKLTEFVLDQIDWKKGLDAWNRIFVSEAILQNFNFCLHFS